ncbi:YhcH/YjgK/YiaL family protein [Mammaliicoccus sciuri]|uniref:YhcH/YjgK/YiaL family protein n=1 Tax=Mammaliicoccus sciuri TaxID=1296 RepID=UPI0021CE8ECA|nr:YhcH/YjgK/YiaL family protein [Mammaliicoccus sciuri]UXU83984.1 YhcH/YjgK/YiaL family protein [Mammaliicoccus sciuri]UXU93831.1 YhcH/YjgK/YiaL family protein [Mammaliicoccus sciuri]UXV15780.1 YhcH/YjgK/YiaL family protein [Mammaliicoccus sciuri]UXV24041.1 YhcH/YjgK/YiaL family protein [Mammaliicoccus sciuri]UXV26823.1 YhcH/YjgK/YiaL family protein [Mammaliicoccus sciuri]
MIIDELKNIDLYKSVIPKEIYDDIKTNLNGTTNNEIIKNFIHYKTESEKPFEQHLKYIDLHIMIKGKEFIGMVGENSYIIEKAYEKQDDFSLGKPKNKDYLITPFNENQFVIFFQGEAHKVGWANNDESNEVEKIVYKFE